VNNRIEADKPVLCTCNPLRRLVQLLISICK